MKSIGITDKEKQLLFIVLALALFACAYFFGFTKLMDQASVIEASNVQDQATVDKLQGMYDRQDETKKETEGYKETIRSVVKKYPIDVPQEKSIYLIHELEETTGIHADTINFSMNNLVMDFAGDNTPAGYYNILGVHFSSTYEQFKEMLKHIRDYPDRSTSPSVSVEYDQTSGYLSGTISYRMFYLTQTDSEFDSRTYDGSFAEGQPTQYYPLVNNPLKISSGVDSIFGSLVKIIYEDEVPVEPVKVFDTKIDEILNKDGSRSGFGRETFVPHVEEVIDDSSFTY